MNKPTMGIVAVLIVFLLAVYCASFYGQDAAAGKAVYGKKCQSCHTADGSGNPAVAKMMNVTIKPLSGEEVQKKSDADIKKTITTGTGKMKPVTGLSEKEVNDVVAYVRTLKK